MEKYIYFDTTKIKSSSTIIGETSLTFENVLACVLFYAHGSFWAEAMASQKSTEILGTTDFLGRVI